MRATVLDRKGWLHTKCHVPSPPPDRIRLPDSKLIAALVSHKPGSPAVYELEPLRLEELCGQPRSAALAAEKERSMPEANLNLAAALSALAGAQPSAPVSSMPGLPKLKGYGVDWTPLLLRAVSGEEITLNKVIAFALPFLPTILEHLKKSSDPSAPPPVVDPGQVDEDEDWYEPEPQPAPEPPDRIALRVAWAKRHGTGPWPDGEYTRQRIHEVFSAEGFADGNNFGRRDKVCFDLSPFAGSQKLERDDVIAAGLENQVIWEIETPIGASRVYFDQVQKKMVIDGNTDVRIGGRRFLATLGYNLVIRPMGDHGDVVTVRAILNHTPLSAEIKFHVS